MTPTPRNNVNKGPGPTTFYKAEGKTAAGSASKSSASKSNAGGGRS